MKKSLHGASWLAVGLFLAGAISSWANAIAVTNTTLANTRKQQGLTEIKFDLSWSNSWRSAWQVEYVGAVSNWDAAWVFVKYRQRAGANTNWQHVLLEPSGHAAPAGMTIEAGASGAGTNVGVFIYRAENGVGDLDLRGIKLRWNYAEQGLATPDRIDLCVHAIEMVYIPQGPFWVGGGITGGTYTAQFEDGTSGLPFRIISEDQITLGGGAPGSLGNHNRIGIGTPGDDFSNLVSKTLPADFPKGYNAFYCMKYEITQGQYTDFLNELTFLQASNLFGASFFGYTNRLTLGTNQLSVYTNAAPDRALLYMLQTTALPYLDWAGLRPMTELEYEKACRGPRYPVASEYAWGTLQAVNITNFFGEDGSGTETALPINANINITASRQPARVGIFAKSATSREQAAAGFFGVMDLAGNVSEGMIGVGSDAMRAFSGNHGDGSLAENGYHDQPTWPADNNFCLRGWPDLAARVSSRSMAHRNIVKGTQLSGYRGVRTAP